MKNMKRIITTIIVACLVLTLNNTGSASNVPNFISGWDGPFEEGVTWFATEDLSIHGGFDPELEIVLDGATPFPDVAFQIVNSADKTVTVEPFYINVRIYRVDGSGNEPLYSFHIPLLEGTLPAHTFYAFFPYIHLQAVEQ